MAYRRYSRTRRSNSRYSAPRGRRRTSRRRSVRRGSAQRIVIQVMGGASSMAPISATVAKKGVRPLRRRF